jgi:hypothetical protein
MRAMLFLLIGFAGALLIGGALFSPAPMPESAAGLDPAVAPAGGAVRWWCAVLAWLTALLAQPRWLWITHMILVTLFGLLLIAVGLFGFMLDAGFNPGSASDGPAIVGAGVLIMASRALAVYLRRRAVSTQAPA